MVNVILILIALLLFCLSSTMWSAIFNVMAVVAQLAICAVAILLLRLLKKMALYNAELKVQAGELDKQDLEFIVEKIKKYYKRTLTMIIIFSLLVMFHEHVSTEALKNAWESFRTWAVTFFTS